MAVARNAGLLRRLGPREMLLPGFVDCHIHAPQYSYVGTGLDLPLMGPEGWLERYTFPSERSLGRDPEGRARAPRHVAASRAHSNWQGKQPREKRATGSKASSGGGDGGGDEGGGSGDTTSGGTTSGSH